MPYILLVLMVRTDGFLSVLTIVFPISYAGLLDFTSSAAQPKRNAKNTLPVQKLTQSTAVSAVPIKYMA